MRSGVGGYGRMERRPAGDTAEDLLAAYPWLEPADIQACLLYARKVVAQERIEPLNLEPAP